MEKDPENGETNADGLKTLKYCSYCYKMGTFNDNFTKLEEMVKLVRDKRIAMEDGYLSACLPSHYI